MSYLDTNVVYRTEWGARKPTRLIPIFPSPTSIIIHYIGAPISSNDPEIQRVRSTQNYHMDTRKWTDVAYNFLVGQSGKIYVGRGRARRNAANRPSKRNLSICALLGTKYPAVSDEMLQGIQELIWDLVQEFPTIKKIKCHKNLKATSCPGPALTNLVKDGFFTLRKPVVAQLPTPAPNPIQDSLALIEQLKGQVRKPRKPPKPEVDWGVLKKLVEAGLSSDDIRALAELSKGA